MMPYKASMDRLTKTLTILVPLLLLPTFFIPFFKTNTVEFADVFHPNPTIVMPFGIILILIITYGFSPKGYAIEDKQLMIHRPFHRKFYSTSDMLKVSLVNKNEMPRSMRVFGVGGLFGYFGLFRNSRYGTMVWYATRRDHFVVIERNNGRAIVLTPDDPNSFVSELNAHINQ
ncbi:MAG: PH domain-containing protein [Flavobacteriales bacterium]